MEYWSAGVQPTLQHSFTPSLRSSAKPFAQVVELLLERARQIIAEFRVVSRDVVGFPFPARGIHRDELGEVFGRNVETGEVERLRRWQNADGCFLPAGGPFGTLANPLQHAAVVAVTGPEPFALGIFAKPIH